jgi:hypothetical protein
MLEAKMEEFAWIISSVGFLSLKKVPKSYSDVSI